MYIIYKPSVVAQKNDFFTFSVVALNVDNFVAMDVAWHVVLQGPSKLWYVRRLKSYSWDV